MGSGFLLTRLSRGVTQQKFAERLTKPISTHTPLARRDGTAFQEMGLSIISTHTPLARRDRSLGFGYRYLYDFYSHASREA